MSWTQYAWASPRWQHDQPLLALFAYDKEAKSQSTAKWKNAVFTIIA